MGVQLVVESTSVVGTGSIVGGWEYSRWMGVQSVVGSAVGG